MYSLSLCVGRCVATLRDTFLCVSQRGALFYKNFLYSLDKCKLLSQIICYTIYKGDFYDSKKDVNTIYFENAL